MNALDLKLEALDVIDVPLSDEFWTGFFAGAGLTLAIAAFAAT